MKFSIKKLLPNFPSITGGINRANKTAIFLFLVAMSSFSINSVSATSSEGYRSLERIDRMYEHNGEYGGRSSTNSTLSLSDIASLGPAEKGAVIAAAGVAYTIGGAALVTGVGVPLAGGLATKRGLEFIGINRKPSIIGGAMVTGAGIGAPSAILIGITIAATSTAPVTLVATAGAAAGMLVSGIITSLLV